VSDATAAVHVAAAPLLQGLSGQSLSARSLHRVAQRYFYQGMLLVYGFNLAEAVRSFEAALALDPKCAACWSALSWSLLPNINTDMAPGAVAGQSPLGVPAGAATT
jgi:hypothetical protein